MNLPALFYFRKITIMFFITIKIRISEFKLQQRVFLFYLKGISVRFIKEKHRFYPTRVQSHFYDIPFAKTLLSYCSIIFSSILQQKVQKNKQSHQ